MSNSYACIIKCLIVYFFGSVNGVGGDLYVEMRRLFSFEILVVLLRSTHSMYEATLKGNILTNASFLPHPVLHRECGY